MHVVDYYSLNVKLHYYYHDYPFGVLFSTFYFVIFNFNMQ